MEKLKKKDVEKIIGRLTRKKNLHDLGNRKLENISDKISDSLMPISDGTAREYLYNVLEKIDDIMEVRVHEEIDEVIAEIEGE